jgi:ParB/RepB/Spo0J family partition protein
MPILIVKYGEEYVLIDGCRRYLASQLINMDIIPAVVLEIEDKKTIFSIAIKEKKRKGELNIIEIANLIMIGYKWNLTKEEFASICQLINISYNDNIIKEYVELLEYPQSFTNYIERYNVAMKQATKIMLYTPKEEIDDLMNLAETLSIRPVELIFIAEMLFEIGRRETISFNNAMEKTGVKAILLDKEKNRNQKLAEIKTNLIITRYPNITKYNEMLEKIKSTMFLTSDTEIKWDKSFENYELIIETKIKCLDDIEKLKKDIEKNSENLNEMIRTLNNFGIYYYD